MSFWSKLGKGLAIGGAGLGTVLTAGAASPALLGALGMGGLSAGTAGALGAAAGVGGKIAGAIGNNSKAIGDIGAVASGAAKGSADQRLREADPLLREQQLLQQGARDQFSAGLQGADFDRAGQDRQRKQQILMSLLNNTQDQSITPGNPAIAGRMPQVTGGARPSNLTGNREALMALLQAPQIQAPQYQAPAPFSLPKAGFGEKALGGVGLGGSILGALGPLLGSLGKPQTPQLTNVNDILDRLGRTA
jgi:hypothetical protein